MGAPFTATNKTNRFDITKILLKKEFEDIRGELRIRISKKNRQHNG
jgi:hypothetical protein